MGGCRCTYKNCTLRTDGVTHMFHYPVFDKVRCHQWLTNAQKLEFLNLKVSQLKNRVVCQHHFKDNYFMNFLKDKLTFDAVPTEDGPYCDTSQLPAIKQLPDESKLYSISLDDIENECLTFNDKKANFSVKYGDFLTNCELMDLDSMNVTYDNTQITKENKFEDYSDIMMIDNNDKKNVLNPTLSKPIDSLQGNNNTTYSIHLSEVPVEVDLLNSGNINSGDINFTPTNVPQAPIKQNISLSNKVKENPKKKNCKERSLLKEKKKITILNEQNISEPVSVQFPVQLEKVSPSTILPLPTRRNVKLGSREVTLREVPVQYNENDNLVIPNTLETNNNMEQTVSVEDITQSFQAGNEAKMLDNLINVGLNHNLDNESKLKVGDLDSIQIRNKSSNPINKGSMKKSNSLLIKNRIPPERMAAIEEKRKFNMKLRDIIASCLDKLDDEEDKNYNNKSKLKSKIENNITQKVSSYLAKEPELPSMHDYTVTYLEARMKKMEEILLRKIDQNSQRIMELKQSLSPTPDKKVAKTQTVLNEDLQKKHLYQEISKYLSPEANNLLYEELFINKYAQKLTQCSPTKKRKRRR